MQPSRRGEHSACGQDTFGHILIGAGAAGVIRRREVPPARTAATDGLPSSTVAPSRSAAVMSLSRRKTCSTPGAAARNASFCSGERTRALMIFSMGKPPCSAGPADVWDGVLSRDSGEQRPCRDRNASFRRLTALLYHGAQRNGIIGHWDGSRQSLRIVRP